MGQLTQNLSQEQRKCNVKDLPALEMTELMVTGNRTLHHRNYWATSDCFDATN